MAVSSVVIVPCLMLLTFAHYLVVLKMKEMVPVVGALTAGVKSTLDKGAVSG
jgi:hypothetical protein